MSKGDAYYKELLAKANALPRATTEPKSSIEMRFAHVRYMAALLQSEIDMLYAELNQPELDKDEWISSKEAAAICKISSGSLTRIAKEGRCEAKRVGNVWRFPKSKVEDMSFMHKS